MHPLGEHEVSGTSKETNKHCKVAFSMVRCHLVSFFQKKQKTRQKKRITLLRVIPTMTTIRFVTGKSSGILSDISSGI